MRLLALLVFAVALIIGSGALEAHPGHIADDGHGHSHWLALIILAGLGAAAAGALVFRFLKGRLPFFDAERADR